MSLPSSRAVATNNKIKDEINRLQSAIDNVNHVATSRYNDSHYNRGRGCMSSPRMRIRGRGRSRGGSYTVAASNTYVREDRPASTLTAGKSTPPVEDLHLLSRGHARGGLKRMRGANTWRRKENSNTATTEKETVQSTTLSVNANIANYNEVEERHTSHINTKVSPTAPQECNTGCEFSCLPSSSTSHSLPHQQHQMRSTTAEISLKRAGKHKLISATKVKSKDQEKSRGASNIGRTLNSGQTMLSKRRQVIHTHNPDRTGAIKRIKLANDNNDKKCDKLRTEEDKNSSDVAIPKVSAIENVDTTGKIDSDNSDDSNVLKISAQHQLHHQVSHTKTDARTKDKGGERVREGEGVNESPASTATFRLTDFAYREVKHNKHNTTAMPSNCFSSNKIWSKKQNESLSSASSCIKEKDAGGSRDIHCSRRHMGLVRVNPDEEGAKQQNLGRKYKNDSSCNKMAWRKKSETKDDRNSSSVLSARTLPISVKTAHLSQIVCTAFLRGEICTNERCKKRHDIPKEMATPICSFFQKRGGQCCSRGAACPFRHVKVNANAAICAMFASYGYCDDMECTKKHLR